MNVDGLVSSGLGGPAILPLSLAKMAQDTKAFPDKAFSGSGGISEFARAQLLPARLRHQCSLHLAMLDRAIGPTVIKNLIDGMQQFMDKRGYRVSKISAAAVTSGAFEDSPAGR